MDYRFLGLSALLAVAVPCESSSQSIQPDAIDEYVEGFLAERGIPGASIAILEDGKLVKAQGYGLADIEHGVPVTTDTIFQSGSLGKMFTAAAIILLEEDGKLSLDDPIAKYYPDAPDIWSGIRIHHLLSHTAGLRDYDPKVDWRKDYGEDELVRIIADTELLFEPGAQWAYCNSCYVVLGALVSKLTGSHWSEFVDARVFDPAGMKTAQIIDERRIIPHRASGYEREDGVLKNQEWVSPGFLRTGDGALYFSIMDLAHWDQALRRGDILSPAHYDAWWQASPLNDGNRVGYGYGWETHYGAGPAIVEHGGIFQGFHSYLIRYDDPGLTVAVLANAHLGYGIDQGFERDLALGIVALKRPELADRVEVLGPTQVGDLAPFAGSFRTPDETEIKIRVDDKALLVSGLSNDEVRYVPIGPRTFANPGADMFFAKLLTFSEGNADEAWFGYWEGSPLTRLRRVEDGTEPD
ncbi:serine hydrolase domain-containing protein [Sphingomicrobium nitratireducens]|uniref:serine hydrolase domain-containing protein n=1 Tax=Sphingomicrobium nitratireducens TaxID=2964666 RepID=UPI00223E98CB|nr:serine hydrolase domain-containing protein [Sphingomicrobium nitratireducens]